jgi:hypothetical protein
MSMQRVVRVAFPFALAAALAACSGTTLQMPSYQPRAVAVPAECEALVQRAAGGGLATMTDAEARTVAFCQHQQLLRAEEEEAASRKLEAHARAASFGLQVATVVLAATFAALTWAF